MTLKEAIKKALIDIILDTGSFRVQLIYVSYLFNAAVLWACIFHGLPISALILSYGSLTLIYTFYFSSKQSQAKIENAKHFTDPTNPERDPDNA